MGVGGIGAIHELARQSGLIAEPNAGSFSSAPMFSGAASLHSTCAGSSSSLETLSTKNVGLKLRKFLPSTASRPAFRT